MAATLPKLRESLPAEVQMDIDDACESVGESWADGDEPDLAEFLVGLSGPARLATLFELVCTDRDAAFEVGRVRALDEYRHLMSQAEFDLLAPHLASQALDGELQLHDYEILEEINKGCEGVVYKALHRSSGTLVALKMVKAGRDAAPDERARLRREVKAVRKLDHPNIVRVLDDGEHECVPYFAMEYLEGGDLSDRIASERLSPMESVKLMLTLAKAMDHVHRRNIVHRDLKPANVLLTTDGQPKIADFGFAKHLMPDPKRTLMRGEQTGEIVGTISYMSPEQANGEFRKITPATDTHALGAIFYELLTGRAPFRSPDEVRQKEPTLPTTLERDVTLEMEAVCMKCLEKDPSERYSSAGELAEDLRRIVKGLPISVPVLDEWERRERWCRQTGYDQLELVTIGPRDIVYRARDKSLEKSVVLKVMSDLSDPKAQQEFNSEARQLGRLQHPNIVQTHFAGERNGRPFVVMEFVEGKNLHEKYGESPASIGRSVDLVGKLADAIHYAHENGIYHCALKPGNIIVQSDRSPKITNFGSFAQVAHPSIPMAKRTLRPLPYYLAPEIVEGRADDIGPATDTYALGAVLYQLLTGRPPYEGDSLEEIYDKYTRRDLVRPTELRPQLPELLERVCLRALRIDDDGYSSAEEFAQDLRMRETDTQEFDLLPGYEILDPLGRGGLGVVYRARHVELDLPVAVKLYDRLEPAMQAHMWEARRRMAQIHHPNLLAIRDGGTRHGVLYTIEELVEGTTLEEMTEGKPLPASQVIDLFRQIADALDYAHQFGVIHRKLKPGVILVNERGVPKISSFELAKLDHQSPTDSVLPYLSTPRYLAPEQFSRDPERIVVGTDIYAVGAILYKALTGRDPFRGRPWAEIEAKIRSGSYRPVRDVAPGVPTGLAEVCARCLRIEPAERYRSAKELGQALDAVSMGAALTS